MNKFKNFVSTAMLVALITIGLAASLMFRVGNVSVFTIIIVILGGLKLTDLVIAFHKWMGTPFNVKKQATAPARNKPTASAAAKDNSQF